MIRETPVCGGRRLVVLFPLLLLLGACGASPSAPQQADQEAKQFPPPAPDKGALYVYRSSWFGAASALDVGVVGGATAQLAPNTFIRIEGPPGPVEVDCKVGKIGRASCREGGWVAVH